MEPTIDPPMVSSSLSGLHARGLVFWWLPANRRPPPLQVTSSGQEERVGRVEARVVLTASLQFCAREITGRRLCYRNMFPKTGPAAELCRGSAEPTVPMIDRPGRLVRAPWLG
jgi:hypothetical protein